MAIPETEEKDHFGSPSYRVRDKIFAQLSSPGDSSARGLVKLSSADQEALMLLDPSTFVPAAHWGRYGWTYIELAAIEASTFRDLLEKSRNIVAPKQFYAAQRVNVRAKAFKRKVAGNIQVCKVWQNSIQCCRSRAGRGRREDWQHLYAFGDFISHGLRQLQIDDAFRAC